MFTRAIILNTPNELKDGDVITGARVNYINHESDKVGWVRWHGAVVGSAKYVKERLVKSHAVCQFRVNREVSESEEPIYTYVKGQGWVPHVI